MLKKQKTKRQIMAQLEKRGKLYNELDAKCQDLEKTEKLFNKIIDIIDDSEDCELKTTLMKALEE